MVKDTIANLLLRHGDMLLEDGPDDRFQQWGSCQGTIVIVESAVLWLNHFDEANGVIN